MQLHPQTSTVEAPDTAAPAVEASVEAGHSRLKRRLLWSGAITAVVLLLIFVPPLINANRYRLQIARSMSASLGRPVHLDNVKLHLLPVPGLTLSNLVVSEDPAFGDEPTIRADSVEATLRLGSLWRRRVEFSSVRFIEPHVNLVRNAEGRWNLANVLLHASHVDTAPTVQQHAGPTPRFPYIEATGGRVNVKLAEEKLPFAITDADFALWLPSPNRWSVRLTGQPLRTDIDVTDPGRVRVEGELQRAATAADVSVNLRGSWHDAPMGEASRILTGSDLGWRGTLNVDASLGGTLGASQLLAKVTLGGLRRADFAAAHPLDLQVTCGSELSVETVTLTRLLCRMPDDAPTPMTLEADTVNLQHADSAPATIRAQEIPLRWALLWAALFSARVPTDLHPTGTVALDFEHLPAAPVQTVMPKGRGRRAKAPVEPMLSAGSAAPWNQWTGVVQIALPEPSGPPSATTPAPAPAAGKTALPLQLVWRTGGPAGSPGAATAGPIFHLQPVVIPLAGDAIVTVNASISAAGYTVNVAGTASPAGLLVPARYLPQLGDGLDKILPFPPTGLAPSRVDFSCTHPWGALQTCTSFRPAGPAPKTVPLSIIPQYQPQQPAAPLLAPRSLSPLDNASPLGGLPASQQPPASPQQQPTSPRL